MLSTYSWCNLTYAQWIDSWSIKTRSKLPLISWLHCDFYWFSIESTSVLCTGKILLMNTIQTRVLLYSNGFCFKFSQENSNFTVACEMHALKKERPTSNKDRIQIAISLKLNKFQSISKRFWTLLIFRQRYNLI